MSFGDFVKQELKAAPFQTSAEDPKSDLFHTSLESAVALLAWTKKARNAEGERFDLHAGFVDVYRPNALADSWRRRHFIGMHSSLFVAICEFALFCFTQSRFFADVGDPSQETSPAPWDERVPGLWLLDHTAKGGRVEVFHSQRLIPKDGRRFEVALYLGQVMARFAWLHELAHCFNGHVDYAKRNGLATRLYELADDRNSLSLIQHHRSKERTETMKCLEFDADRSAFWASYNIQRHGLENIAGIAALNETLRLRLAIFGAYAMTWLIEQFQSYLDAESPDAPQDDTHPEPSLRLQNLFRTIASDVMPKDPRVGALHDNVLNQFDVVQAAIPKIYGRDDLIERMRDAAMMDRLKAFDPRAETLKADLKAFEFTERA